MAAIGTGKPEALTIVKYLCERGGEKLLMMPNIVRVCMWCVCMCLVYMYLCVCVCVCLCVYACMYVYTQCAYMGDAVHDIVLSSIEHCQGHRNLIELK